MKNQNYFCPICNSKKIKYSLISEDKHGDIVVSNKRTRVFVCSNCNTYYTKHIFSNTEELTRFYPRGKLYFQDKGKFLKKFYNKVKDFAGNQRIFRINKYIDLNNSKLNILDVGCGKGHFLSKVPSDKFNKFGIDMNRETSTEKRSNDYELIHADFIKYNFGLRFDIITFFHSFEHSSDPISTIRKAHKLLNENGILAVIVPNTNSLGCKLFQKTWFHLDVPRHTFIPNEESMKKLLKEAGFEILNISNPFWEYPFDIYYSTNNIIFKILLIITYPLVKIYSNETIFIIAKNILR